MVNALEYACSLVAAPSVSRDSNVHVSNIAEAHLVRLGFQVERQQFLDPNGVPKVNVIGKRGAGVGGLAYFCHTDVVPADTWSIANHGPFQPTVRDGRLYGRGSCDMKGSLACMLAAAGRTADSSQCAPLYVVCTADEEVGFHGAREVVASSELYREMVVGQSRAIIGEPTELNVIYAHKGIFGFRVTSRGKAAHSSTREGINANVAMIPFLAEMKRMHDETLSDPAWNNREFDPPWISWNIGINDHHCAVNITAPESVCTVYFRPMPGQDADGLVERARLAARQSGLEFQLECRGQPLYGDRESSFVRETLKIAGQTAAKTVSYGTDGVCFTELKQILVMGPGSIRQAHTDDEWISLSQLDAGTAVYEQMVRHWCVE